MADIPQMFTQVHAALNDFTLIFADALILMLVWLGKRWQCQIASRVQNERVRNIMIRAETLAVAIVKRTFQEYVKPAKDAGRWTPEAEKQAYAAAVAELRSHLGYHGIQELAWVVFGEGAPPEDVTDDGILKTLIEAAVHDTKQLGHAMSQGPKPTPPLFPALAVARSSNPPSSDLLMGATGPLASGAPSQTPQPVASPPATVPQAS